MNQTARRFLVSLGTIVAAGASAISLLASGVDVMQGSKQFEDLQQDATALNVAAQNLFQLTKECGYTNTKPAENILRETASLAGFDAHVDWSASDDLTLTITRSPDYQANRTGSGTSFTYTDDIKITDVQDDASRKERTPEELRTLARMCEGLK